MYHKVTATFNAPTAYSLALYIGAIHRGNVGSIEMERFKVFRMMLYCADGLLASRENWKYGHEYEIFGRITGGVRPSDGRGRVNFPYHGTMVLIDSTSDHVRYTTLSSFRY